MIQQPSPNFDDRNTDITMLVLHYTGMKTAKEALDRLCDPTAKVSAHYMIDEDGTMYQLVSEQHRAWHAGKSFWRGLTNINAASIGIELVNPGHEFGYRPFPEQQMQSLIDLSQQILNRHPIPARNVVGHSDIAPARKTDPGELFNWNQLANHGIGLWPDHPPVIARSESDVAISHLQKDLSTYGYDIPQSGDLCDKTKTVITAFHRHFLPENPTDIPTPATTALIKSLLHHL